MIWRYTTNSEFVSGKQLDLCKVGFFNYKIPSMTFVEMLHQFDIVRFPPNGTNRSRYFNATATKLLLWAKLLRNKTDNQVWPRGVCSVRHDFEAAPQEATITF